MRPSLKVSNTSHEGLCKIASTNSCFSAHLIDIGLFKTYIGYSHEPSGL